MLNGKNYGTKIETLSSLAGMLHSPFLAKNIFQIQEHGDNGVEKEQSGHKDNVINLYEEPMAAVENDEVPDPNIQPIQPQKE